MNLRLTLLVVKPLNAVSPPFASMRSRKNEKGRPSIGKLSSAAVTADGCTGNSERACMMTNTDAVDIKNEGTASVLPHSVPKMLLGDARRSGACLNQVHCSSQAADRPSGSHRCGALTLRRLATGTRARALLGAPSYASFSTGTVTVLSTG